MPTVRSDIVREALQSSLLVSILSTGAGVGTLLSLVHRINLDDTSLILNSLLGAADDELLSSLLLVNLGGLISDLTVTSHGTVNFSYEIIRNLNLNVDSEIDSDTYPFC